VGLNTTPSAQQGRICDALIKSNRDIAERKLRIEKSCNTSAIIELDSTSKNQENSYNFKKASRRKKASRKIDNGRDEARINFSFKIAE
jgi:hypothetical protein